MSTCVVYLARSGYGYKLTNMILNDHPSQVLSSLTADILDIVSWKKKHSCSHYNDISNGSVLLECPSKPRRCDSEAA